MTVPEPRRGWHHASIYGDGDRTPLDPGQLAGWKWRVRQAGAAGRISLAGRAVAAALASFLGPDGALYPSYESLVERCRQHGNPVSRRTIARQLAHLRTLGLVSWQRRLARAGRHVWQTSNAYCLRLAALPAALLPERLKPRDPTSRAGVALGAFPASAPLLDRPAALAALATRAALPPPLAVGVPVQRNVAGFRVWT